MEIVEHLKFPLEEIKLATSNFSDENFIASGGFGKVYKGKLVTSGEQKHVAVKRLDRKHGQGDREFLTEIQMLSCYKHKNLISLVGFCKESSEDILVYEYAKHGSLDKHLADDKLSWLQRLKISLGAARGFYYLHNDLGLQHRVLHRDIKSSNIGYVDPQYVKTGILTKESDVYSFGVVLFEILCGRPAIINTHQDDSRFLASLAQRSLEQNILDEIIFPGIKNEMKAESLKVFTMVAYQCLKEKRTERPTMTWIVERLEKALELQTSNKVGGWAGGQTVSEVTFEIDEEIIGIKGRVGTRGGYAIISSLSFETNKRTHGPFGGTSNSHEFSIPWDNSGSLVGFYGIAGYYIDEIGVYVKAREEIMRIGTWGSSNPDGEYAFWSFKLESNHHLKMITVDHGDLIYSLMFTTQYRGLTHNYKTVGGWNGGDKVSEVTFDWNEEIIAISGTVALSRGPNAGYTIISSLSFLTNIKTHGPFGSVRGTPFMVTWDDGSFEGFYGTCGYFLDSIGVLLKATRWDI
ncbi:hypothetical protein R6Q59_007472 [Mikania micrantha]